MTTSSTAERTPETLGYDNEVIYDVTTVGGKTYRGQFSDVDGGVPTGWVSLTLYDGGDESKTEQWIHLNPAYVVSVQVWLS